MINHCIYPNFIGVELAKSTWCFGNDVIANNQKGGQPSPDRVKWWWWRPLMCSKGVLLCHRPHSIDMLSTCEIRLQWVPFDPTDVKSTFVQVVAWCCGATSHYMRQCWARSITNMVSLGCSESKQHHDKSHIDQVILCIYMLVIIWQISWIMDVDMTGELTDFTSWPIT